MSFIDSNMALCAFTRGRSASGVLRLLLKRASVLSLAYGLYQAGRFAPTRWNSADQPTRDTVIPPARLAFSNGLLEHELRWIASCGGLRRWTSIWLRLCLLLGPPWPQFFSEPSCLRKYCPSVSFDPGLIMDFDSSLGFPGEGPCPHWLVGLTSLLTFSGVTRAVGVRHGDSERMRQREGIELPDGRRVMPLTTSIRGQLGAAFNCWLREEGMCFEGIFLSSPPDLDKINEVLTRYGRQLFAKGKPYYHLSETINLVSARRPVLSRSLQQAWDLCAMWTSFEQVEHHRAMPVQVLLAVLSTCLAWGWTREAALFAMCWGMLLRSGELLNACRRDIVFPQDVRYSIDHVLIKILEPKTRFRAARHQSSKLEPPDLIQIAWIGLGRLKPHEKVWPGSPSTLRHRLDKVLTWLGLPIKVVNQQKPLTLASFCPGGATYLIGLTESAELVRRRGRWLSWKVMDIYLQEVAASTFMTDIPTILTAMENFESVLQLSVKFFNSGFPEKAWNLLFKQHAVGDSFEQAGRVGQKLDA